GSVEMVDGAGQMLNTMARGKYRIHGIDASSAEVEFYELVEVNPYDEDEKIGDVDSFRVKAVREESVFPFREETALRIEKEDEWPCLLYRARYVFESDPLEFGRPNQAGNLYHLLEDVELDESVRYYYIRDEVQRLTARELEALGIPRSAFW
ncbi:MAG: hypothetical protein ABIH46_02645, partial [Chloroflexota bacterium]